MSKYLDASAEAAEFVANSSLLMSTHLKNSLLQVRCVLLQNTLCYKTFVCLCS